MNTFIPLILHLINENCGGLKIFFYVKRSCKNQLSRTASSLSSRTRKLSKFSMMSGKYRKTQIKLVSYISRDFKVCKKKTLFRLRLQQVSYKIISLTTIFSPCIFIATGFFLQIMVFSHNFDIKFQSSRSSELELFNFEGL